MFYQIKKLKRNCVRCNRHFLLTQTALIIDVIEIYINKNHNHYISAAQCAEQ